MTFNEHVNALRSRIFQVKQDTFDKLALEIFRFQFQYNEVYRSYAELLKRTPESVNSVKQIPFLPVSFYKSHRVLCGEKYDAVFESSATTGQTPSKHYVADVKLYEESFLKCFNLFFGTPEKYCMLMLLPSYLERQHSSLVYMADVLIKQSKNPLSSFYLYDYEKLHNTIQQLEEHNQPYLLLGVTFALLEFSEKFPLAISSNGIVIETGGMKGRGKEMVREELHTILKDRFKVQHVFSEYGMTELLSQAYMKDDGKFHCPPWMKVMTRDAYNPLSILNNEQQGGINVIDFANLHSCSFIETGDVGKVYADGAFEVSGRLDSSEIRGCNLMVS
jgi:phenylacetate-coenzyme A ligase PaaK-like adenylate-forming protein